MLPLLSLPFVGIKHATWTNSVNTPASVFSCVLLRLLFLYCVSVCLLWWNGLHNWKGSW